MGQEFKSRNFKTGWFWPGAPHEVPAKINQGCSHLKAQLELEDPAPRWPMHMTGKSVGSWHGIPVTCHVDLSIGLLECPYNMAADFPQSNWPKRAKWKLKCLFWLSLRSHCHFCNILVVTQVSPNHCGRGLTIQGYEYQEVKITEGHPGGLLPQWQSNLPKIMHMGSVRGSLRTKEVTTSQ